MDGRLEEVKRQRGHQREAHPRPRKRHTARAWPWLDPRKEGTASSVTLLRQDKTWLAGKEGKGAVTGKEAAHKDQLGGQILHGPQESWGCPSAVFPDL